jgi:hypothetical protein
VTCVVREALADWDLDGKRVPVNVPDGTVSRMLRLLYEALSGRVAELTSSSRWEPTGPRLATILTASSA